MKKVVFILVALGLCFNAVGQTKTTKKSAEKPAAPAEKPVPVKSNEVTSASSNEEASAVDPDIANAKMVEYMTPGAQHEWLAGYAGDWREEISFWSSEKADPIINEGKCVIEMIMGGRYLMSTHRGEFSGMPFEGQGTIGYDNITKTFTSTWIDNFGTGTMVSKGILDPKIMNLVLRGDQMEPVSGKTVKMREVYSKPNDNEWTLEMFTTLANGKEYLSMRIRFSK
jgi:Protein of unknown function (DUF1579)